jgi:hypothetical protein
VTLSAKRLSEPRIEVKEVLFDQTDEPNQPEPSNPHQPTSASTSPTKPNHAVSPLSLSSVPSPLPSSQKDDTVKVVMPWGYSEVLKEEILGLSLVSI